MGDDHVCQAAATACVARHSSSATSTSQEPTKNLPMHSHRVPDIIHPRPSECAGLGDPYFRTGCGGNVVGLLLDDLTDWTDLAELLTESYCLQAPAKLAARVRRPQPLAKNGCGEEVLGAGQHACRVLKFSALLAVIGLGLTVWCLVEAIAADESRIRRLPKPAWILLIVLLPFLGPIAWLLVGRPSLAVEQATAAADFAEFERPGRLDPVGPSDPAKDAAYRELLRRRAEEQRRRHEEKKQQQQKNKESGEPEVE